jgi:hypothetical protein
MNAFVHILNDARPIDIAILAIGFLILLLLIGEQISRISHRRNVNKYAAKIFYALAEGQALRAVAPNLRDEEDPDTFSKWRRAVQLWTDVTRKTLEACSANAVISFMHNSELALPGSNNKERRPEYESLIVRLNNLRCIMEHVDAYVPR